MGDSAYIIFIAFYFIFHFPLSSISTVKHHHWRPCPDHPIAKIYGEAVEVASSADKTFSYIPDCSDLDIPEDADYVYICENNTIYGTKFGGGLGKHILRNQIFPDNNNHYARRADILLDTAVKHPIFAYIHRFRQKTGRYIRYQRMAFCIRRRKTGL